MEVYLYLYDTCPLYMFTILTLKHITVSVIVTLEFAVQVESELHVKITYQSS